MAALPAFWRDHPWRLRAAALALAAALVAALASGMPQLLRGAEEAAGDAFWRLGASTQPERRIVVVDIDEASLRAVGPWPWPRETVAQLSDRLQQAGAAVQVFDIVFPEAKPGDAELAAAWARAPVVAGQIFSLDPAVTPHSGVVAGALAADGCPDFAPRSHGYIGNAEELVRRPPTVGHLTPRLEGDGVVRKVPALICHEGRAYPTLALAALWRAGDGVGTAPDWTWATARDQPWSGGIAQPYAWLASRQSPGVVVPLDAEGNLRVPFRVARRGFASVSAADVLGGTADRRLLAGTIALVGATAFGIGDAVATPQTAVASGLEVHAQALVGLLDGHLPYTPMRAAGWQVLAMLVVAAALLAVAVRRGGAPVKRLPIAGALLAVACYAVAGAALLQADLWLPWLAPALFALLASTALATAEHALTRAQRERLSAHLVSYLPAPVAERLMASDPTGRLQVDRRDVSVLVADIRNFSAFAAHRPPEETAALLHAFCSIAVEVVEHHGGVVENVVGDSVLAVWNAYSPCQQHPQRALEAAEELLRATRTLLDSTSASHGISDHGPVQPLALGIGLESGSAIVGSFGPSRRRAHAALGEPVSVASRLQQMTQDLSTPILIGPQLAAALPAERTEPLGDYLLEGLGRQYSVFTSAGWVQLVPAAPRWVDAADAGHGAATDTLPPAAPVTPLPRLSLPLRDA